MVFSCTDCRFYCGVIAELWRAGHSPNGLFPASGTVCTQVTAEISQCVCSLLPFCLLLFKHVQMRNAYSSYTRMRELRVYWEYNPDSIAVLKTVPYEENELLIRVSNTLQARPQGRGHFHRRWGAGGLWAYRHPLLGLPASGRRLCTWHRHNGEAYRQRSPDVMRGHDQRGGRGLHVIRNGVFQHCKRIAHVILYFFVHRKFNIMF